MGKPDGARMERRLAIARRITVDLEAPEEVIAASERARSCLDQGGVALLPAEGLYGLHACAARPAAVERLRRLKQDQRRRPFILLVADRAGALPLIDDAEGWGAAWMDRCWPGPVTLVLPAARALDPALTLAGRVALRCPGSDLLRGVCAGLPGPLLSTSANRAGASPPRDPAGVDARLLAACDLMVDAGALSGEASALVRVESAAAATVLRAGPSFPTCGRVDLSGRRGAES